VSIHRWSQSRLLRSSSTTPLARATPSAAAKIGVEFPLPCQPFLATPSRYWYLRSRLALVVSGHLWPLSVFAPESAVKCNRSKRRSSNAHVPAQRVGVAAPRPAAVGALALHLTPPSRGRPASGPPLTSNVRCGSQEAYARHHVLVPSALFAGCKFAFSRPSCAGLCWQGHCVGRCQEDSSRALCQLALHLAGRPTFQSPSFSL
jgi:hypothetical protein